MISTFLGAVETVGDFSSQAFQSWGFYRSLCHTAVVVTLLATALLCPVSSVAQDVRKGPRRRTLRIQTIFSSSFFSHQLGSLSVL